MALDFLPRSAFLRQVLRAAHGADAARLTVADEVEHAETTLLPEEISLPTSGPTQLIVQPDGVICSPSGFVLIEAKRSGAAPSSPSSWPGSMWR